MRRQHRRHIDEARQQVFAFRKLSSGSFHPFGHWAKQYINFAAAPEINQKWCDALGLPGLTKTFQAPKAFIGDPAYPTREEDFKRLVLIPTQVKVDNWDKWVLRYKSIMNL